MYDHFRLCLHGSLPGFDPLAAARSPVFSTADRSTWPEYMDLYQVAAVLRYRDTGTVRRLTNKARDKGGLPSIDVGLGKRKRRLVKRADLIAWIEIAGDSAPLPIRPQRRRIRKEAGFHIGPRNLLARFGKAKG